MRVSSVAQTKNAEGQLWELGEALQNDNLKCQIARSEPRSRMVWLQPLLWTGDIAALKCEADEDVYEELSSWLIRVFM